MYAIAMSEKIGKVTESDFITLDENTIISDAVKLMRSKDASSVLVNRKGSADPIGIVTERDILYRVVAENLGPFKARLKTIMSSPLISIEEQASVADALSLMRQKRIRRLPVKNVDGVITGVATLMSIVGNAPNQKIDLAEVEIPLKNNNNKLITKKISCPYCQSSFDNKNDLSKHIDRIHIGAGLLEGDLRQQ
jgi:signal-transduction protein with cAMP-binding, CBS, and nucleotidyltransferase domain